MRKPILFAGVIQSLIILWPSLAFAIDQPHDFADFVDILTGLIGYAVPIVFSLALLAFFWGLAKFILHAGDERAVEEGKSIMLWGLIALFVMASIWGIVSFFSDSLGLGPSIHLPQLPTS